MNSDIFKRKAKATENNYSTETAHKHKHYFVKNVKEFEQLDSDNPEIYELVEYALVMCNSPCNHIKKVRIYKEDEVDE